MKQTFKKSGTVLIYTLVLVVLSVFMATAVLNTTVQLDSDQQSYNLSQYLKKQIETSSQYMLNYEKTLNRNGGAFSDVIGCPNNFSMSGTTALSSNVSTTIRYLGGNILCQGTHNGNPVDILFSSGFTDLASAEYLGSTISVNSGTLIASFGDIDGTTIDLTSSYPLSSDGFDDNFNDDDLTPYSSGGTLEYPDNYLDDDANARLLKYGYIAGSGSEARNTIGGNNVFWINTERRDTISNNIFNTGSTFDNIGDIINGRLFLDVDQDFSITIYELDKSAYEDFKTIKILNQVIGGTELSGSGYIQSDLSLNSTVTGSEYNFDFMNMDYAIFIENFSTDILFYSMLSEDISTGNKLYINPMDLRGDYNYFIGGYLFFNESQLFGGMRDVKGLKVSTIISNIASLASITFTPTAFTSHSAPLSLINGVVRTDGDYDYEYHSNSGNAFIDFDWATDKKIASVYIYNRTHSCCDQRLTNATLRFYDASDALVYTHVFGSTDTLDEIDINLVSDLSSFDISRMRLDTVGGNRLNVREIEVYGYES